MPRNELTSSWLRARANACALGLALTSAVFLWSCLSSPAGGLGVGKAFAASVGQVTEFSIPTAHNRPDGIAAGADGDLWFTGAGASQIGRISPTGQLTEYPVPAAAGQPDGLAAGPDGNLWFTESSASEIGRITPTGQITEFPIPTTDGFVHAIAAGPDDNMWFTDDDGIGVITLTGQTTEYALPSPDQAEGTTAAPDGDVWFTDPGANKIGRITTGSGFVRPGQVTEYPIPCANSVPYAIAAGPDGNLWFTELNDQTVGADTQIGRITPGGQITEYPVAPSANSDLRGIAAGPDGSYRRDAGPAPPNLWFTDDGSGTIGRITPAGQITEYTISTARAVPPRNRRGSRWEPLVHRILRRQYRADPHGSAGRVGQRAERHGIRAAGKPGELWGRAVV